MPVARRRKSFPVTPLASEGVSADILGRCQKAIARCERLWAEAAATIRMVEVVDRQNREIRSGINKNYETWPSIRRNWPRTLRLGAS